MSQLVIETDAIKKAVLYFFAIAGIAIIGCVLGMNIVDHYSNLQAQQTVAPVVATPTPAPAPTVAQALYPTVIEFTVLSTTIANGHYTVYTTTGQTVYMPDFYSWNSLLPQNTYSATITGAEANGALDASTVNLISLHYPTGFGQVYSYPVYYHYNGNYFQYDGHSSTPVAQKEVTGQRVIDGQPPNVIIE